MSDLHLADLSGDIVNEPIRKGFGRGLKRAGEENENEYSR